MSEPAHLADMPACGGRHWGWEPAYGTIPPLATIAALAWPGATLPVAAVLRGIQLIAAGPFKFAAAFRPRSIGHRAVNPISQP
jgi:uncharacterized membrane protein HdeD (DUF308 family)